MYTSLFNKIPKRMICTHTTLQAALNSNAKSAAKISIATANVTAADDAAAVIAVALTPPLAL
jgi:hypothetical protein